MAISSKFPLVIRALAIAMFQVVATQVVTFIVSLFLTGMGEDFGQTQPILFGLVLGLSFSLGVFLVGWLALKLKWLVSPPRLGWRILGTLLGAYLPLLIAYLLFHEFIPGNPFFTVSILLCVLGFHLPGWIKE
jgi:hypothetical protein